MFAGVDAVEQELGMVSSIPEGTRVLGISVDDGTATVDLSAAFELPGGTLDEVYPLPNDVLDGSRPDGFIYPVAIYDHAEGVAITNGFAYRGGISALRGKFVFGDIQRGRLFAADIDAMKAADDGIPRTVAPVEEIQLYVRDASGRRTDVDFWELKMDWVNAAVDTADAVLAAALDTWTASIRSTVISFDNSRL